MAQKIEVEASVINNISKELKKITGDVNKFANDTGSATEKTSAKMGGLSTKTLALGTAFTALAAIAGSKIVAGFAAAGSEMETLSVQFKVLLGSAGAAEKRMKELSKFAQTTPFDLKGVATSSKILETLTQGALSSGKGLRMVGDAAAISGERFDNLAVHIGRAYSGLQANRPIGESMMRLQELGLVTGDTRNAIEELQKAGKGKEAWNVLQKALEETEGGMDGLSKTVPGLASTIRDQFKSMMRALLDAGAWEVVQQTMTQIVDKLNSFIENGSLEKMGKQLAITLSSIVKFAVFIKNNWKAIALVAVAAAIPAVVAQLVALKAGIIALTAAMAANPLLLIAAGAAAVVIAVNKMGAAWENWQKTVGTETLKKQNTQIAIMRDELLDLYSTLNDASMGGTTILSSEEFAETSARINELETNMAGLGITLQGSVEAKMLSLLEQTEELDGAIKNTGESVEETGESLEDMTARLLEQAQAQNKAKQVAKEAAKAYAKQAKELEQARKGALSYLSALELQKLNDIDRAITENIKSFTERAQAIRNNAQATAQDLQMANEIEKAGIEENKRLWLEATQEKAIAAKEASSQVQTAYDNLYKSIAQGREQWVAGAIAAQDGVTRAHEQALPKILAIQNSVNNKLLNIKLAHENERFEAVQELLLKERDARVEHARMTGESELAINQSYTEKSIELENLRLASLQSIKDEYAQKELETTVSRVQGVTNIVSQHANQIVGIYKSQVQKNIDSIEQQKNSEIAIIEKSVGSAKWKEKQIQKVTKEADERRREENKKMKAAAMAEAMINTAGASIAAFASMIQAIPGPPGIIAGVAAAAAATTFGMIQVAMIARQNFRKGGIVEGPAGDDQVPANLTAGEMVLTKKDQKALLSIIRSEGPVTPSISAGETTVIIQGNAERADIDLALAESREKQIASMRDLLIEMKYHGELAL